MTTQQPIRLTRRRLLGSSAAVAASALVGCDRASTSSGDQSNTASEAKRPLVPLRLTMVGDPAALEVITRGWDTVAEHPVDIDLIPLDRSKPEGLAEQVIAAAEQTDVLILPLVLTAELIQRELVVPLSGEAFETADQSLGAIVPAVRNGAARFAGEIFTVPLGSPLPFLLSVEELESVDSWQAYDRLVQRWDGEAAEPTAPGWAAAMWLWRSAAERNWLFGREYLEPLVDTEPYVRSLEQMVQTCSRYQSKGLTPQQVWQGVASSELRGGIGFPELRSEVEGNVIIAGLPGTSDRSRVLFDPFSPVSLLASSCRQSAVAKRFMTWMSGGEGSRTVRREVRGMTDTRVPGASSSSTEGSNYDRQLNARLSSPVTMPTLQLLGGCDYYAVLDEQVIRAINEEISPSEALGKVAEQWQAITDRVGTKDQRRVWRRAQGMRG